MTSNFSAVPYWDTNVLQLDLKGDFDGNSAWLLFNLLQEHQSEQIDIVLNTDGLEDIHPFGVETFQQIIRQHRSKKSIFFTGRQANLFRQLTYKRKYANRDTKRDSI